MSKDSRAELERAFRDNRKGLLAWAEKATRSVVDAEDLVQEAFVGALSNLDGLGAVEDMVSWLFVTLRNKVRDRWRRRKTREKAGEVDVAEETISEIVAAAGFDPADAYARAELSEQLADAIDELPAEQRIVIEAQVIDGFTFKEIAEMTGLSIDTLAARKRYAIKKLANSLEDWTDGE